MSDSRLAKAERMLATIDAHFLDTAPFTGLAGLAPAVREALLSMAREDFVPDAEKAAAYCDTALPLACGQTISQPFIVALMTQLLQPEVGDKVLEVGTGSGYQAAILSLLVDRVYSLEVVAPLALSARRRLVELGRDNVTVVLGNGAGGLPEQAPFDKVIITAAAPEVPDALLEQLAPGGRIVAPLGEPGYGQELTVLSKGADGCLSRRGVLAVSFVPFTDL